MKFKTLFIVLAMLVCFFANLYDADAKTVKEIRKELIDMYGPAISKDLGTDWIIKEMKRITLVNPDGISGNYLVVLAFKPRASDRDIDHGKIAVYPLINELGKRILDSADEIEADIGIVEEAQRNLTGENLDSIVITFFAGRLSHVWIYLWKGDKAELISPKDTKDTNISLFSGPDGSVVFKDKDSDGIKEVIVGEHSESETGQVVDKDIIYKWNSTKRQYELWKTEIPVLEPTPAGP